MRKAAMRWVGEKQGRLVGEPELLGRTLAGVQAPEIHGQMPGEGHDGFLALCAGGPRPLAKEPSRACTGGYVG